MKILNLLRAFLTLGVIIGPLPNAIANGQTIDAVPVMADFNWILAQVNANAAPLNNPTFTGTVTAGAGGFSGNVTTAAQTAITSVGTLTSLAVTGATSVGSGSGTGAGLVINPASSVSGGVSGYGYIHATTSGAPTNSNFVLNSNGSSTIFLGNVGFGFGTTTNSGFVLSPTSAVSSGASGVAYMHNSAVGTPTNANYALGATSTTLFTTLNFKATGTLGGSSVLDNAGNLIISSTAPTIASGFGTSPSIVANNTAAFQVIVGSGGTASSGVITMPAAPNGWACSANDVTSPPSINEIKPTPVSTTSITLNNTNMTSGAPLAFVPGAKINFQCTAF